MARTPEVDSFIKMALQLTEAAAGYAGAAQSDPDTNSMLAEVQTVTAALQSALTMAATMAARRPVAPTSEPVKESS